MPSYEIAVLPGDGIGPEVMKQAHKVLTALNTIDSNFVAHTKSFDWNSEYYLKTGRMMPEDGLEQLKTYDAILFGAIGDSRVPDDISVWQLIMPIRKHFKQYVNFRPVKQLQGINPPIQTGGKPIDFVVIRENAEGEYSNVGGGLYQGTDEEITIQNTVMTKKGIKNITQYAFDWALENGKTHITSATKSNAIIHTMKFWDNVVEDVANQSPNTIHLQKVYIDALCAFFVSRPESFEVVLASNLFGDILSDLGSALIGGLGLSPSANINPTGDYPSMFEPVHGSAPDIAGKGIANPIAQIWSTALMLDHLGEKAKAELVIRSIEHVLTKQEHLTPDLGGKASTEELGDAIVQAMLHVTS
jgi:tartrate dehydrogenase/decarboxylase/D-malate dehydrogenase